MNLPLKTAIGYTDYTIGPTQPNETKQSIISRQALTGATLSTADRYIAAIGSNEDRLDSLAAL